MSYLEGLIRGKLGDDNLKGAIGFDYKDWSPNNFRGIHILDDVILIERFVYGSSGPFQTVRINISKQLQDHQEMSSRWSRGVRVGINSPLNRILKEKEFQNLEEVSIVSNYLFVMNSVTGLTQEMLFPAFKDEVLESSRKKTTGELRRLRGVNYIGGLTSGIDVNQLSWLRKNNPDALFRELLEAMGVQNISSFSTDNEEWRNSIGLHPTLYALDRAEGPLVKALNAFTLEDRKRQIELIHQENIAADTARQGAINIVLELLLRIGTAGHIGEVLGKLGRGMRRPYLKSFNPRDDDIYLTKDRRILKVLLLEPVEMSRLLKDKQLMGQFLKYQENKGYYSPKNLKRIVKGVSGIEADLLVEKYGLKLGGKNWKQFLAEVLGSVEIPAGTRQRMNDEKNKYTPFLADSDLFYMHMVRVLCEEGVVGTAAESGDGERDLDLTIFERVLDGLESLPRVYMKVFLSWIALNGGSDALRDIVEVGKVAVRDVERVRKTGLLKGVRTLEEMRWAFDEGNLVQILREELQIKEKWSDGQGLQDTLKALKTQTDMFN